MDKTGPELAALGGEGVVVAGGGGAVVAGGEGVVGVVVGGVAAATTVTASFMPSVQCPGILQM